MPTVPTPVTLSPAWRPSVAEVGRLIRARTYSDDGGELGTFVDGKTNPSATVVEGLITDAVGDCLGTFGWEIPDMPGDTSTPGYNADALRVSAALAAAKRAAAYVELTRFPEQVANGRSPYAQLIKEWETGMKSVAKSISDAGSNNAVGATDDTPQAMSGGFVQYMDDDEGFYR